MRECVFVVLDLFRHCCICVHMDIYKVQINNNTNNNNPIKKKPIVRISGRNDDFLTPFSLHS